MGRLAVPEDDAGALSLRRPVGIYALSWQFWIHEAGRQGRPFPIPEQHQERDQRLQGQVRLCL